MSAEALERILTAANEFAAALSRTPTLCNYSVEKRVAPRRAVESALAYAAACAITRGGRGWPPRFRNSQS